METRTQDTYYNETQKQEKKINSRTRETHGEFSVKWRSYDHIKANSYNWQ